MEQKAFSMRFFNSPISANSGWSEWLSKIQMRGGLAAAGIFVAQQFIASEGDRKYFNLVGLDDATTFARESHGEVPGKGNSECELSNGSMATVAAQAETYSGLYKQIYPEGQVLRQLESDVILAVGLDVDPAREDEFHAWYNTDHIPAHLQVPGILNAYRFVALEQALVPSKVHTPKYVTLYEVENEQVFQTAVYEKSRHSPWTQWMRQFYTRRFRSVLRRAD
ncbi:MAG: hypothetical protein HY525_07285 [Betaproteobacteria bacterium]|nr:hypothetical protein [Betaproteobacteria bacterium]